MKGNMWIPMCQKKVCAKRRGSGSKKRTGNNNNNNDKQLNSASQRRDIGKFGLWMKNVNTFATTMMSN